MPLAAMKIIFRIPLFFFCFSSLFADLVMEISSETHKFLKMTLVYKFLMRASINLVGNPHIARAFNGLPFTNKLNWVAIVRSSPAKCRLLSSLSFDIMNFVALVFGLICKA
uniref:Secreted protein n=1 Tax=Oryza brachyantha TaxID=4533 RepID=J3MDB0_ORYBR